METQEKRTPGLKAVGTNLLLPFSLTASTIVFTTAFFAIMPTSSLETSNFSSNFRCNPHGVPQFSGVFDYNQPNWFWEPSLFLDITLGFGRLTFIEVKAIDLAWDLIVGRGGQLLLGVYTYRIVRKSMARCMEQRPMSVEVFTTLSFEKISLNNIWPITRHGLGPKASANSKRDTSWVQALPIHAIAVSFVIIYFFLFPTIISAMTGYQSNFDVTFQPPGAQSEQIPIDRLEMVYMIVSDGHRVGLPDNYSIPYVVLDGVTYPPLNGTNARFEKYNEDLTYPFESDTPLVSDTPPTDCTPSHTALSPHDAPFNWGTPGQTCFSFFNGSVPDWLEQPGTFNASAVLQDVWSSITLENMTWQLSPPPLSLVVPPSFLSKTVSGLFLYENETMDGAYVLRNAACQPTSTYRWGFSSLMLFSFCIATAIFFMTLQALQWNYHWHSRSNRQQQSYSAYHDALHLAMELKVQLGKEIEDLSAAETDAKVKSADVNLGLDTQPLLASRWENLAILSWWNELKWTVKVMTVRAGFAPPDPYPGT